MKVSMEGRVCAHTEQAEWERLLRRSIRALQSTQRLIATSYDAMRVADSAPAGRLLTAWRRLVLVPDWMYQAQQSLDRAMGFLQQAIGAMALAPRMDAPAQMIRQSQRLMQATSQLALLSGDAMDALGRLRSALDAASENAAAEEQTDLPPIVEPDPDWRHSFLGCLDLLSDRLRSLKRRRRSPLRVAGAPRRISRGRAPPLAAICQPCL